MKKKKLNTILKHLLSFILFSFSSFSSSFLSPPSATLLYLPRAGTWDLAAFWSTRPPKFPRTNCSSKCARPGWNHNGPDPSSTRTSTPGRSTASDRTRIAGTPHSLRTAPPSVWSRNSWRWWRSGELDRRGNTQPVPPSRFVESGHLCRFHAVLPVLQVEAAVVDCFDSGPLVANNDWSWLMINL